MLNEILLPDTVCFHIGKQLRYNIELVVTGENLLFLFLLGILLYLNNDLRVVSIISVSFSLVRISFQR